MFSKSRSIVQNSKILHQYLKGSKNLKHFLLSISFIDYVKNKLNIFERSEDKFKKYWSGENLQEILKKSDELLDDERYMDAYEMLSRLKYSQHIDVAWRTVKALWNLSFYEGIPKDIKKGMVHEAYGILKNAVNIGSDNAYYHKWMAIILDRKNGLEGLDAKVKGFMEVLEHLNAACKINSKDFTTQYMLGKWHYEMANLTWFQRLIARYFFVEPPHSNFEKAFVYLNQAEELQPRTYLPNIYLLGSTCIKLGQNYRAKYYLNVALNLPTNTDCDTCCALNAKRLLLKLEKYDLGKDLLYENSHNFGFES